jgi:hypothetical protein
LNEQLIHFLVSNAINASVCDCLVSAAIKFADFEPFWSAFAESASINVSLFAGILLRILDHVSVNPELILPFVPAILLNNGDVAVGEVRRRLWGCDVGRSVLSGFGKEKSAVVRGGVVAGIRGQAGRKEKVDEAIVVLCGLCEKVSEETEEAIGLIIDQFAGNGFCENGDVSATLRRLIATPDECD